MEKFFKKFLFEIFENQQTFSGKDNPAKRLF